MSEHAIKVQMDMDEATRVGGDIIPVHVIATERPEDLENGYSEEDIIARREANEKLATMADKEMSETEREAFDARVAEHKAQGAVHAHAIGLRTMALLRQNDAVAVARSNYGHDHK